MRVRTCLFVVFACLIGQTTGAQDAKADKERAVKQELDKLQGLWQMTYREFDGKKTEDFARLTIKKDLYSLKIGPGVDQGTFKIDPTTKPGTWDARSEGDSAVVPCIYELSGDQLKLCYFFSLQKRPNSFTGRPGSDEQRILYVFRRVKE